MGSERAPAGSGHPDLFFANDYGISQLFVNRAGKRFEEIGRDAGVARTPKSGYAKTFAAQPVGSLAELVSVDMRETP